MNEELSPPQHTGSGCGVFSGAVGLLIALVIGIWILFRPVADRSSPLTPGQRAELNQLMGTYKSGGSSPMDIIPNQAPVDWTIQFFLVETSRMECMYLYSVATPGGFGKSKTSINTVRVEYCNQDSGKTGYIQVASSMHWKLYVEAAAMKPGKLIKTIVLDNDNFGEVILYRQ